MQNQNTNLQAIVVDSPYQAKEDDTSSFTRLLSSLPQDPPTPRKFSKTFKRYLGLYGLLITFTCFISSLSLLLLVLLAPKHFNGNSVILNITSILMGISLTSCLLTIVPTIVVGSLSCKEYRDYRNSLAMEINQERYSLSSSVQPSPDPKKPHPQRTQSPSRDRPTLSDLPKEVVFHIASFNLYKDFIALTRTCRSMKELKGHDHFFQTMYKNVWSILHHANTNSSPLISNLSYSQIRKQLKEFNYYELIYERIVEIFQYLKNNRKLKKNNNSYYEWRDVYNLMQKCVEKMKKTNNPLVKKFLTNKREEINCITSYSLPYLEQFLEALNQKGYPIYEPYSP